MGCALEWLASAAATDCCMISVTLNASDLGSMTSELDAISKLESQLKEWRDKTFRAEKRLTECKDQMAQIRVELIQTQRALQKEARV